MCYLDEGGGWGGHPCLFYDKAGNEVEADQRQEVMPLDPHERFMDCPDASPETFARGVDQDG